MARLIDADALQETFGKECDGECTICSHSLYDEKLGSYCGLIMNAPTVEISGLPKIHYDRGFIAGYEKGKAERPQGEWITTRTMIHDGNPYCSICDEENINRSKFCPNCGADMRGKEE